MAGGLMQLVAYGAQDVYLTGSPSITFFKTVYRRHTSFASESIEQTINGTTGFGRKVSVTISRNGDLIHSCYLEVTLKKGSDTSNSAPYKSAEAFIESVEWELGGQRIDILYSSYLRLFDELFRKDAEKAAYDRLVSFDANAPVGEVKRFYVPLIFSWNRNVGLSLPLIALQYHETKLLIQFASAEKMSKLGVDVTYTPTANVFVEYILLDASERKRFAQGSHEYLITQIQHVGPETVTPDAVNKKSITSRLNFNHPVKHLAFALAKPDVHGKFSTASDFTATNDSYGPLFEARLTLNGHERESARRGSWFNSVIPYQTVGSKPAAGCYLYSFALRPAEYQPSGTCNMSRVDNASLHLTFKAGSSGTALANIVSEDTTLSEVTDLTQLLIFAENYNVLRIMSGMGGLAYSN